MIRNWKRAGLAVLTALALLPAGASAQVTSKVLHAALYWQETSEWCWAASGETIMNYLGPTEVKQCYEANAELGHDDCCSCPTPASCVQAGWPQFDHYGYTSTSTSWGTALSFDQLKAEIDADRPFLFSWAWNGGGAHAMVAKGYVVERLFFIDMEWVVADNPWPPVGRCDPAANSGDTGGNLDFDTYAAFVGGPGFDHTHGADVYAIQHP